MLSVDIMRELNKTSKKPMTAEQFKRNLCEANLRKVKPRHCPKCGSKYLYYNPMAGPIVGGLITMHADKDGNIHPSRGAHPIGQWICIDCQDKFWKDKK